MNQLFSVDSRNRRCDSFTCFLCIAASPTRNDDGQCLRPGHGHKQQSTSAKKCRFVVQRNKKSDDESRFVVQGPTVKTRRWRDEKLKIQQTTINNAGLLGSLRSSFTMRSHTTINGSVNKVDNRCCCYERLKRRFEDTRKPLVHLLRGKLSSPGIWPRERIRKKNWYLI